MTNNQNKPEWEELREKLADIEHQRWSDWHRYSRLMTTRRNIERWDEQAEIPYIALSEKEKNLDRKQVDRYLPLIKTFLSKVIDEIELEHRQESNFIRIKKVIRQKYGIE